MTDSVTPNLSKAEDLFKSLVWDNLIKLLVAEVPALGVWPLSMILTYITDKIYSFLRLTVDLEAVPLLSEAHKKAFDSTTTALKIIAKEKGIDSDEYKKAKEAARAAFSDFIRFAH